MTKEDMQWSINHQNKPLTKKYTDTILNVIGNLSNKEWIKAVYVNFIMRYTMWIMDQGVEINV